MKRVIILLFNIIFGNSILIYAQTISIHGKIIDKDSLPIEYVNIGIEGKDIGTISNSSGNFQIDFSQEYSNEAIVFSALGYKKRTIKIGDISGLLNIQLADSTYQIKSIEIKPSKIEVLGSKKGVKGVVTGGLMQEGFEIGRIFKPKTLPVRINYLRIYFQGSTLDTCTFRINFYTLKDDIPNNKIVFQNIIFRDKYKKGWLTFDLKKYNILLNNTFFSSIEWLPDKDLSQEYGFWFGAKLSVSKKTYSRKVSLGKWNKLKIANVIMNIELEY